MKKNILIIKLFSIIFIIFSINQLNLFPWEYPSNSPFLFHIGVPISTVKSDIAAREGMDTTGAGIELGFGVHLFSIINLGCDVGFEYYDDKNQFTQSTTSGSRASEIHMPYVSLLGGYRLPVIPISDDSKVGITAALSAGRTWLINERRAIDNCSGCSSEDINLNGGYFFETELDLTYALFNESNFGIGLSYRHYFFKNDLERRFIIKLSYMGGYR